MKQQSNNWTQQLLDQTKGNSTEFKSENYDTILSTKQRLERKKLGTWQTCKKYGADTFTVKRTS